MQGGEEGRRRVEYKILGRDPRRGGGKNKGGIADPGIESKEGRRKTEGGIADPWVGCKEGRREEGGWNSRSWGGIQRREERKKEGEVAHPEWDPRRGGERRRVE